MKVSELIATLQGFPQDSTVAVFSGVRVDDDGYDDIRSHEWVDVHDGWQLDDEPTVCLEVVRNAPHPEKKYS